MKYFILILASLMMLFVVKANVINTQNEESKLKEFDKISSRIAGEINITKGDFKIEKHGTKSQLDNIEFLVKDKKLIIQYKSRLRFNSGKVKINITMPSLDGASVSGSGKICIHDAFKGSDLKLSISGSGKIEIEAPDYQKLDCSIAGSGDCDLLGKAKVRYASVNISGSGNFGAEKSDIKEMYINIAGSGDCDVSVKQILEVKIAGSGKVVYSGDPEVKQKIAGSGKVLKK